MRRVISKLTLAVSVLALPVFAQTPPQSHFDGKSWWEHVKVLADDNMEGRETGSAGLRHAQTYVVDQLKKSGLEPAGADGFYQSVKFIQRQVDETNSNASLLQDGRTLALVPGDDMDFSPKSS